MAPRAIELRTSALVSWSAISTAAASTPARPQAALPAHDRSAEEISLAASWSTMIAMSGLKSSPPKEGRKRRKSRR